jgi:hypothetical protein
VRPEGNHKADRRSYHRLGHGSHLVDLARLLCGDIVSVRARLAEKFGAFSWFVSTEFADGSIGHLDLTMSVRMQTGANARDGLAVVRTLAAIDRSLSSGSTVRPADVAGAV